MVGKLFIDGLFPPVVTAHSVHIALYFFEEFSLRRAFFSAVVTPRRYLPGLMSLKKLNVRTHCTLKAYMLGGGVYTISFFSGQRF